jgi:hypothetical protein
MSLRSEKRPAKSAAGAAGKSVWEWVKGKATKTGALDEDALAELPSALAEQLRAAWARGAPRIGYGESRRLTDREIVL